MTKATFPLNLLTISYCVPLLPKFLIQPHFLRTIRLKQIFINIERGTVGRGWLSLWLQGGAEPQRDALYLWSTPDCNGDEEADEIIKAEDDEVQHCVSSPGLSPLPYLAPICHKVLCSPSLSASRRNGARPYSTLWQDCRGSTHQKPAVPGLIRTKDTLGLA